MDCDVLGPRNLPVMKKRVKRKNGNTGLAIKDSCSIVSIRLAKLAGDKTKQLMLLTDRILSDRIFVIDRGGRIEKCWQ
jgi:hypothetical protein